MLDGCMDWHVTTDLEYFVFPTEIALTTQRPDIVLWSVKFKKKSFRYWVHGPFLKKISTGNISVSWENLRICENNVSEMAW